MRIRMSIVALLCISACFIPPAGAQTDSERMDNLTALYMVRASESLCGFMMTDEQRSEVLKATQFFEGKLGISKEKAVELYRKVVQSMEAQAAGGLCDSNGEWAQAFKQTVGNLAPDRPAKSSDIRAAAPEGSGAAAPAPASPPPGAQPKSAGLDAGKAILGNTITGSRDGREYADYYAPDGKIVALDGGDIEVGRWTVEGEAVCTHFPSEGKVCYRVNVTGETVNFVDRDGTGFRGTILKGNPMNLQ